MIKKNGNALEDKELARELMELSRRGDEGLQTSEEGEDSRRHPA